MNNTLQINIPSLVRIKPGALDRLGIYLRREKFESVLVLTSPLPNHVAKIAADAFAKQKLEPIDWIIVDGNHFENAIEIFSKLPKKIQAIVAIGGGKALDTGKYVAFLARLPYIAVPTSLSNDGFCSPQSSLTLEEKRRSFPAAMPKGVVVDVDVCLGAPKSLWLSGVGDLVSKLTAVVDWKLAFHATGEPVDDLAALLSDATVYQFMAAPTFDASGTSLLATALMLNGIAMEMCGSSRPASGGEHLISHALDAQKDHFKRPRLHGLQVGVATYIVCHLQGRSNETINRLFQKTGFWEEIKRDPFSRDEWLEAVRLAPGMKEDFYTILSSKDCVVEVDQLLDTDPVLQGCFESSSPASRTRG